MLAEDLSSVSVTERSAQVVLQNQLVPLLSEQLYRSPIKAIEELVVNSYDAAATECRLFVPTPAELAEEEGRAFIVVFDDGEGMTIERLVTLWDVGRSPKTATRMVAERKQIGKFGIGKLATYAVARRLTYVTKTKDGIFNSTLNFNDLKSGNPSGDTETKRVDVPIKRIAKFEALLSMPEFLTAVEAAAIDVSQFDKPSWTLAILEELREKAKTIKHGRLKWVLSTAMPLRSDFRLYLNGEAIASSKESIDTLVEFSVADLSDERLEGLNEDTGQEWTRDGDRIVSKMFPSGIHGKVIVARKSLTGGKSDDLERSHGYFVRALGRLINLEDPLFGMPPLSHKYFHRLRVDINADDLDEIVVAAREGVEFTESRRQLVNLFREIFNEARNKFDEAIEKVEDEGRGKHESDREYVPARYVEHPLADVLTAPSQLLDGADADRRWFYLEVEEGDDTKEIANRLYNESRSGYNFQYIGGNSKDRLVKFNPSTSTFTLNENHEFVRKHRDNGAIACLEDFVIAETLLEVYLREEGVSSAQTGEILQRRDELLRSLANDELHSPERIAQFLEDASENEHDLEIGLVVAARALGFTAAHLSGANDADGVAVWVDHPRGVRRITLEAKSSKNVPSLAAIDFAGLQSHVTDNEATGCLLLAPDYPGASREENARAAKNAKHCKISCWTIRDLSRVVRVSQSRHITAESIINIVENVFEPREVEKAVDALLAEPTWDRPTLTDAIISALSKMEGKLEDAPRSIDHISALIAMDDERFKGIRDSDIQKAIVELAAASQGSLVVVRDGKEVRVLTSMEEVARRASGLSNARPELRKPGKLKNRE